MENDIHQYAAKGFQVSTDAYERGRPNYPQDAINYIVQELGLGPQTIVADLAAGTGKMTRMLQASGSQIVAIEPVEGMRKKFASQLPKIEVLNGTAERMPLASQSLDAIVVAQAFHWFNGNLALQEIHRVLKPNAKMALVWNVRDENIEWVAKLNEIIDPYEKGAPRYRHGAWKKAFSTTTLYSDLKYSQFTNIQTGDIEMIVDRISSISFIASLSELELKSVQDQVRKLVEGHLQTAGTDIVEMPYRTDVFVFKKV